MHESLDEFKFRQICNRLIDRIEFLFNIFKTNRPIKTKFCKHIIIDKIYFGKSLFFANWQESYGP